MPPTTGDVVFGITANWWSVLATVAVIVVGFWLWRRRKRVAKVSGGSIVEKPGGQPDSAEIVVTTDGFLKCFGGRELFRVRWQDVREVRAYKRDLLTTDLICLGFRDTEDEEYFEVHEEMAGFDQLRTRLLEVFPTIASGWFEKVMRPPFATNLTVLFRRGG